MIWAFLAGVLFGVGLTLTALVGYLVWITHGYFKH